MRFALLLIISGALLLPGCGSTPPKISEVETEIRESIDEAQAQGSKAPLKGISLVDAGERHWEGYIEFGDGTRANLDVRLGEDNKYIWKISN